MKTASISVKILFVCMVCYGSNIFLFLGQSMHPSAVGGQHSTKKVQKNRNNYASVECGAKILAANPEAKVSTY